MNVGMDRITRSRAVRENIEILELSSEDSSYYPSESYEDSPEVSFTDSDRVEDAREEVESEERVSVPEVIASENESPVRGSEERGRVQGIATVDLCQFFEQMGEHIDMRCIK